MAQIIYLFVLISIGIFTEMNMIFLLKKAQSLILCDR